MTRLEPESVIRFVSYLSKDGYDFILFYFNPTWHLKLQSLTNVYIFIFSKTIQLEFNLEEINDNVEKRSHWTLEIPLYASNINEMLISKYLRWLGYYYEYFRTIFTVSSYLLSLLRCLQRV